VSRFDLDGNEAAFGADDLNLNSMEKETNELQKEAKAYLDAMRCESLFPLSNIIPGDVVLTVSLF